MSEVLAVIEKNASEEIQVALSQFKGRKLIDVRTWLRPLHQGDQATPTRKGVTVRPDQIDELIAALDQARDTNGGGND